MITKSKERRFLNPNTLFKIIAVFLIIDFFAFQKELSNVIICILLDIPLLLFAAVNIIWAQHKELPFWHPLVPYSNFLDEGMRVFFAYVSAIFCIFFTVLITVVFLFY